MLRIVLAGAALAVAVPATAQQAEINYPEGSLGYTALTDGDYRAAIQRMENSRAQRSEPAQMLNLGYAHERLGDDREAGRLYREVLARPDQRDLIKGNGERASSHELARTGLKRLTRTISRQ